MRAHPHVLQVRCKIHCDAKKWEYAAEVANTLCQMMPESSFGPIPQRTRCNLDLTKEARDTLLPVADKFTDEWRIPFQLGCYSCQLGDRKEAFQW